MQLNIEMSISAYPIDSNDKVFKKVKITHVHLIGYINKLVKDTDCTDLRC